MMNAARKWLLFTIATLALILPGCSGQQGQPQTGTANRAQGTSSNSNSGLPAVVKKTTASGTITADPNPVKVCDGSGIGTTVVSWNAVGSTEVDVRIGAPDGAQFARTNGIGRKETGKWIINGTVLYLQDVAGGKPLTGEYTIATVTVNVTTEGCP